MVIEDGTVPVVTVAVGAANAAPAVTVAVGATNAAPAVVVMAGAGPMPDTEGAVVASPIMRIARRFHRVREAKETQLRVEIKVRLKLMIKLLFMHRVYCESRFN